VTEPATDSTDAGANENRSGREVTVFRDRSVSYLELPATDPAVMADFYEAVFGWEIRSENRSSFTDGSGHVIGHFIRDLKPSGETGPRPFVYVDGFDNALRAVETHGGQVVRPKYVEGNLWVATFRDPSGNVVGLWELIPEPGTRGLSPQDAVRT